MSELNDPLSKLMSLETDMVSIEPRLMAMLYGAPGGGKTVLAFKLAQAVTDPSKEILYIDTAQGWVSLLNHEASLRTRVRRFQFDSYEQLRVIHNLIKSKHEKFANIGCVIFDEASVMQRRDLTKVVEVRAKADVAKDPDFATQPDYATETTRYMKFVDPFSTIEGIHFICVAHQREDPNNLKLACYSPAFLPKLTLQIIEAFHLVGRVVATEVSNTKGTEYKRFVQSQPLTTVLAKCRVGTLPTNSDFATVVEKTQNWIASGGVVVEAAQPVIVETFAPIVIE